jgi:hypothetical protein
VVIASPIYKAAYPGALKALLDLLPQATLAGKIALPLATPMPKPKPRNVHTIRDWRPVSSWRTNRNGAWKG